MGMIIKYDDRFFNDLRQLEERVETAKASINHMSCAPLATAAAVAMIAYIQASTPSSSALGAALKVKTVIDTAEATKRFATKTASEIEGCLRQYHDAMVHFTVGSGISGGEPVMDDAQRMMQKAIDDSRLKTEEIGTAVSMFNGLDEVITDWLDSLV